MIIVNNINWLGVGIATVANIILGMLWYSPYLFGKIWANALRFNINNLNATPLHYGGAMIIAFVTTSAFSILLKTIGINSYSNGLCLALLIWCGFIATTHFSQVLWARRPLTAYLVETGFSFVSLMITSLILTALR